MPTYTLTRIEELRQLLASASTLNVREDAAFQALMREAPEILEMSEAQIADGLSVSRPTYNRWINGRSLPHVAMRTPAVSWVIDQLNMKIKARKACA
jgi:hypothetical protein